MDLEGFVITVKNGKGESVANGELKILGRKFCVGKFLFDVWQIEKVEFNLIIIK